MQKNNFIQYIKDLLLNRNKEISKELKQTKDADPFMKEFKDEGSRNLDESGEEASDMYEHVVSEAIKEDLTQEKSEVGEALNRIEKGTYGICVSCGKKITEDRMKINPTADKCIECEKKAGENA